MRSSFSDLAEMLLAAKNGQRVDPSQIELLAAACENELYERQETIDCEEVGDAYIEETSRLCEVYTKLCAARKGMGL